MTEMTERRIRNILTRMLDKEDYYTNASPRISYKEIEGFWAMGIALQVEHMAGANAGDIAVYLLNEQDEQEARKWLESHGSGRKKDE